MKKMVFLLGLIFAITSVVAQVPGGFSYQAVVRNTSGEIAAHQSVKFRFSLLQGSATGTAVYVETQSALTNSYGMANLTVGQGTPASGTFDPTGWGTNSHFLKVELDPDNGNIFTHLGTTQLMAVPYAFHAKTAEQIPDNSVTSAKIVNGAVVGSKIAQQGATSGQVLKWNGTAWAPAVDLTGGDATWSSSGSNLYYNTGNIGVGTSAPTALLHTNGNGTGDGNVLFAGQVKGTPGNPPVSGPGTRMMWYPDKAAFRVGEAFSNEWDLPQIGNHSIAMGHNVKASGSTSFSIGLNSSAEGTTAIAMGFHASATGAYAKSIGNLTTASGNISTAMGTGTIAPSFSEFVIGRLNTEYTPLNATNWNNADRLFVVGNGADNANRSDAMVIMKHGGIGLGISQPAGFSNLHLHNKNADQVFQRFTNSVTGTGINDGLRIGIRDNTHTGQIWNFENGKLAFGTHGVERMTISNTGNVGIGTLDPSALLHVSGFQSGQGNVVFMGSIKWIDPGAFPVSGAGTRMMWYPDKAAFRAGDVNGTQWDAPNIGNFSVAFGFETLASGENSSAFGTFTKAEAYRSAAFGYYNVGGGNPTSTVASNPLFEIGNGTSSADRANAFTVLKNGRTGINLHNPTAQLHINTTAGTSGLRVDIDGTPSLIAYSNGGLSIGSVTMAPTNGLRVSGESSMQQKVNIGSTASADATLHIRHTNPAAGIMPDEGLRIQNMSAANRSWTFYTFSSNGALALYSATGGAVSVGNFNAGTGAYTATSNRHLKTNVLLLGADILTRIQQLQPVTYSYLRDPLQQRTIGFMAEDVQPLFPELVDTVGENGENLAINYAGFSVVAIKAIQVQQEKITLLEKSINQQQETIIKQQKLLEELMLHFEKMANNK
jgi:hypothetical protein